MKYRRIGASDLSVSEVGIGCNNFGTRLDAAATSAVVHSALDAGITFFDTADIYGRPKSAGISETLLGEALVGRRDQAVIATKFGIPMGDAPIRGGSRSYIREAVEGSLRRLRTDYIDLYQMHVPDRETPLEETLRALDELAAEGKIRYAGCSNFAGWQVADASWTSRVHAVRGFVSNQYQYSLLVRGAELEVIPAIEAHGLAMIPFFPLASGLLTGKYRPGEPPPSGARLAVAKPLADRFLTEAHLSSVERLRAFCEARNRSLTSLAFAWLLAKSVIPSVIAGASTPAQVETNAVAAEWSLSAEDVAEVDALVPAPKSAALV